MVRNLTSHSDTPFTDEDNDRPMPSGSYGIGGWTGQDRHILLYDKYDLWQMDTRDGQSLRITDGREASRIFRIRDLNPQENLFASSERFLLTTYHDLSTTIGFYDARL